jgi:SAM-dependent methyltransferase
MSFSSERETMTNDPTPALTAIAALGLDSQRSALIRGALVSGFLGHCRSSISVESLSAATGLGAGRVGGLCAVLREFGVLVEGRPGEYVLSSVYGGLFESAADVLATSSLQGATVRGRLLEGLFTPSGVVGFLDLQDADRAALAASVAVDPFSPLARQAMGAMVRNVPTWEERFVAGGRFLELGCGVAGALLTWLRMYPGLTAVGVDLAGDLIDSARHRAEALGVADRATFVTGDATTYDDPQPFDTALWSQFFFPRATRKAALDNAFARLRPQGLLVAPVLPDAQFELNALLVESWGVPALSAEQLATEFESAGFRDAKIVPSPATTVVVAARP